MTSKSSMFANDYEYFYSEVRETQRKNMFVNDLRISARTKWLWQLSQSRIDEYHQQQRVSFSYTVLSKHSKCRLGRYIALFIKLWSRLSMNTSSTSWFGNFHYKDRLILIMTILLVVRRHLWYLDATHHHRSFTPMYQPRKRRKESWEVFSNTASKIFVDWLLWWLHVCFNDVHSHQ